jgi:hypothetical protein
MLLRVSKPRAEVLVSVNASPEFVESVVARLRDADIDCEVGRYEQRSAELPDFITLLILLKAVGIVGDEVIRQVVRDAIEAWKGAGRSHAVQGSIEVPTDPPTEYNLGLDVPDEALDVIEEDMRTAEPGDSRYWHRTEHEWVGFKELHRLDWEVEVADAGRLTARHLHLGGMVEAEITRDLEGHEYAQCPRCGAKGAIARDDRGGARMTSSTARQSSA